MGCDRAYRSILYRLTSVWNSHLLSFKSSGSAVTEQVNSACCSDGKLHLETCLFSHCASKLNPATTGSLDLIKKKTQKQRSRAYWKVTACSYLMLGTAWNQSLKQSLQEVFWPQSHSLVMTVSNCLQKLNQWLCLSSPSMDTRCGIQISLNLLASPNAATQHDIHLRGKSSNWDWVTRSSVPFFP